MDACVLVAAELLVIVLRTDVIAAELPVIVLRTGDCSGAACGCMESEIRTPPPDHQITRPKANHQIKSPLTPPQSSHVAFDQGQPIRMHSDWVEYRGLRWFPSFGHGVSSGVL